MRARQQLWGAADRRSLGRPERAKHALSAGAATGQRAGESALPPTPELGVTWRQSAVRSLVRQPREVGGQDRRCHRLKGFARSRTAGLEVPAGRAPRRACGSARADWWESRPLRTCAPRPASGQCQACCSTALTAGLGEAPPAVGLWRSRRQGPRACRSGGAIQRPVCVAIPSALQSSGFQTGCSSEKPPQGLAAGRLPPSLRTSKAYGLLLKGSQVLDQAQRVGHHGLRNSKVGAFSLLR